MSREAPLFNRIEPESEVHRTNRALAYLNHGVILPFKRGRVRIETTEEVASSPGGQRLLTLLVNLLARMKGIVGLIEFQTEGKAAVLPGIPLRQGVFTERLAELVASFSGPNSEFSCSLRHVRSGQGASRVVIAVGTDQGHVRVGSDSWRALLGNMAVEASWHESSPIGPYMAATLAAMETLKLLIAENYQTSAGRRVENLALSLWNLGINREARRGPALDLLKLSDLAVAGAGAGGTATLYTLASFERVTGRVGVVEAGSLKLSSLGRYLMTDYYQVHTGMHKLSSARMFLSAHAPDLELDCHDRWWREGTSEWSRVVSTVDTSVARRDIQQSEPELIIDAGVVLGSIYSVLRVTEGGWCLECKHPYDPLSMEKRRAAMWGLSLRSVQERMERGTPVTMADLQRLALVQNRPVETYSQLEGRPFDQVPTVTECGETPLTLQIPSQAPVLPMATTAAGVVIAGEVVKDLVAPEAALRNYWCHDLRHPPRQVGLRFKPASPQCGRCLRRYESRTPDCNGTGSERNGTTPG